MKMLDMAPIKFEPFLRTMVWGGDKILRYKGLDTDLQRIGESWELSAEPSHVSVVAEGPLKGRTLPQLVAEYKGKLVGEHVYARCGNVFPLLLKFIDAHADLSIQVHPDDAMAARVHGAPWGKTEMWYVVDAEPGASLYCGLTAPSTPAQLSYMVASGKLTDILAHYYVKPGDVFFLPAGRIHAICSGCLVAEIQQTSDLTYRIWDYGRVGLDGKPRPLHTELALQAVDYKVLPTYQTAYEPLPDEEVTLVSCPYFTTSLLDLTLPYAKDLSTLDSFVSVMCLSGSGALEVDGAELSLSQGETVLIPAAADDLCLVPDGSMKVLLSHIN